MKAMSEQVMSKQLSNTSVIPSALLDDSSTRSRKKVLGSELLFAHLRYTFKHVASLKDMLSSNVNCNLRSGKYNAGCQTNKDFL